MKVYVETNRLLLRELLPSDERGMFELDSDKEVHRYLGNTPVTDIAQSRQVIIFIRRQYAVNGIGRWAVTEKGSGNFIGWAGLKLVTDTINNHTHFYDLGYRLIRKYWGKGFATEAAIALVEYGFTQLKLQEIYGMAVAGNLASKQVLQKAGLYFIETFDYEGEAHDWFAINHPE